MASTAGCLGKTQFDARTRPGDAWPVPRYDPAGTAHNPHASPPRTIATDWRTSTGLTAKRGALVVAENTVVVGGRHRLVAVDSATGTVRWQKKTGASALGYRDGILYTAHANSGAGAFRLEDGTQKWQTADNDITGWVYGLVPTASSVLVAVHNSLLCFNNTTGERQWLISSGGGVGNTGIAVAGGTVIQTDANLVTAYEPSRLPDVIHSTPKRVWQTDWRQLRTAGHTFNFPQPPSVANGRVYVGETDYFDRTDAQVYAFSADDGHSIWQTNSFGYLATTPALAGGRGYFLTARKLGSEASLSVTLRALTLDTGTTEWTRHLPRSRFIGEVSVADGMVISCGGYSGTPTPTRGLLTATNAETGKHIWQIDTKGSAVAVALVDKWVYVGTEAGEIYRLSAE